MTLDELIAEAIAQLKALVAWIAALELAGQTPPTAALQAQVAALDWALIAGAVVAAEQLGIDGTLEELDAFAIPASVDRDRAERAVNVVRETVAQRVQQFERVRQSSPQVATSQLRAGLNNSQAGVAGAVVEAHAQGQEKTAFANGAALVWRGERDACVVCTGFIGAVRTKPSDRFKSAGFDGVGGTIALPPVHPHCRCEIDVVDGDPHLFAEALRREAVRQVLKGWRRESESNAERVRAAEALLKKSPAAPKTVLAGARKAVQDRKFPNDGRTPTGQ